MYHGQIKNISSNPIILTNCGPRSTGKGYGWGIMDQNRWNQQTFGLTVALSCNSTLESCRRSLELAKWILVRNIEYFRIIQYIQWCFELVSPPASCDNQSFMFHKYLLDGVGNAMFGRSKKKQQLVLQRSLQTPVDISGWLGLRSGLRNPSFLALMVFICHQIWWVFL